MSKPPSRNGLDSITMLLKAKTSHHGLMLTYVAFPLLKVLAYSDNHFQKTATDESENKEWAEKYGEKGAKVIRECVDENVEHYEYLKQFAIKV